MLRAGLGQASRTAAAWRGLSTMSKRTRYEISEETLHGANMEAKTLMEGDLIKLDELKGKAVLVSNVATT